MMKKIILFFITFLFIQPAFCFYLPETFFPGRQSCIYSEKCPKDKPFLKVTFNKNRGKTENIQETEECVGCDYLGECEQYEGHEHDLDICPNRRLIKTTDEDSTLRFINILKECPQGMIKRRDPPYECVSCMIKEKRKTSDFGIKKYCRCWACGISKCWQKYTTFCNFKRKSKNCKLRYI